MQKLSLAKQKQVKEDILCLKYFSRSKIQSRQNQGLWSHGHSCSLAIWIQSGVCNRDWFACTSLKRAQLEKRQHMSWSIPFQESMLFLLIISWRACEIGPLVTMLLSVFSKSCSLLFLT